MIGSRLSGRYKIIDTIGGGGMANVYLARDMILDRDVAVKVLRPDFSDDQDFIRRFHREAQAAASLDHPNIVSIYDVGEENKIFYIVMEVIEGTTLKQYIQKYAPLSNEESVNIMTQLTSAIAHAHENHIVHRDIKPQNILIDENGIVKVTDFGIAVALSQTTITQTNSFLGSVHYLSPEQARGGMATKKSDIYSLGIVMFELVTGRLPFFGESAVSIALKHLQNDTPSPKRWNPTLPQSLENITLKSTAKDTFHRYDSIEAMDRDLRTALEPRRLNEPPFKVPVLDGDVTKAIPIITNERIFENTNADDTLVHHDKKTGEILKKKRNIGRKIAIWVISIFFLLATAGVASITILPSLFLPGDVTVPDVANEPYHTAYKELDQLGLVVGDPIDIFDETIEEGLVVRTDPKANSVTKEGSEIIIYRSKGKEKEEIDNYIGQNINEVTNRIRAKFKNIDSRMQYQQDIPEGQIYDQIPKSGEYLLEETEIIFFVSDGPPPFQVANFKGLKIEEVTNYVEQNLLILNISDAHSEEYEKDYVISQTPPPGSELRAGDAITVTISLGPVEKPPKSITKEVSVKYEPTEENQPQEVLIYVNDLEHREDANALVISEMITADKVFMIDLIIPYESSATYRVVRDGRTIEVITISYNEV